MLQDHWDTINNKITNKTETKRTTKLIKDVKVRDYFDLVCKVVCTTEPTDEYSLIGLTDFTSMDGLQNDAELLANCVVPYPIEVVVCCTLWDENAGQVINAGDYLFLRNLRCKLDSRGRPEFVLHGDPVYMNSERQSVKILSIDDELVKLLVK